MTRRAIWAVAAGLICLLGIVIGSVTVIPQLLYPHLTEPQLQTIPSTETRIQLQQAQAQLQNNVRSTLLQAVAGLLVVGGAIATWRQVQVSHEGHLTGRFTQAIDQLGSDTLDTRIGGLYALERIAHNSKDDRTAIAEVIAAFLRGHAPWLAGDVRNPNQHPTHTVDQEIPWLRDRAADVHAAITILGRHPAVKLSHRLSLSRLDLRKAYLSDSHFLRATIRGSNLAACWARRARWEDCELVRTDLRYANLEYARLNGSQLRMAFLDGANLKDTHLIGVDLTAASMRGADLQRANLTGAKLHKVDLRGANLYRANLTRTQLVDCQIDATTILPDDITGAKVESRVDTDGLTLDE